MMTWTWVWTAHASSTSSSSSSDPIATIITDVYVPEECLQIASPLDHILMYVTIYMI